MVAALVIRLSDLLCGLALKRASSSSSQRSEVVRRHSAPASRHCKLELAHAAHVFQVGRHKVNQRPLLKALAVLPPRPAR